MVAKIEFVTKKSTSLDIFVKILLENLTIQKNCDNIRRVNLGILHKPWFLNTLAADQLVFQNRGFY